MLSFLSKQQKTSTIYFKHCHLLRRNVTKFAQKPLPQTCVLSRSLLPTKHNVFFNKGLITQEPLLLMPGATRVQVSGLRCLTPAEYSLLEAQTPEGVAFREAIYIMAAKVLFHLKSMQTIDDLEVTLVNIFKGTSSLKVSSDIVKYMPDKRFIVYLQHLTVFILGHKVFPFKDLEFFCGSDISCASFKDNTSSISVFIEVMMFKHLFKHKLGNPYLKFHLINPDALIPQFNIVESKEMTTQKNADFLVEYFFKNKDNLMEKITFYLDIKSYSQSGIGYSRFSILHGSFKGSYEREINNIIIGLTNFMKNNALLNEDISDLISQIQSIKKLKQKSLEEKYNMVMKKMLRLVFDPIYRDLKISLAVDVGSDVEFNIYYEEVLKPIIDKLKYDNFNLKDLFPKDGYLPDLESKADILDPLIESLVTAERLQEIKDEVKSVFFRGLS